MSYEHPDSGDWLEQYHARQAARAEQLFCAIEEGRTHVIIAGDDAEANSSWQTHYTAPTSQRDE